MSDTAHDTGDYDEPVVQTYDTPWRRRLPLLPALIFTILLTQIPFVMSLYYSTTKWVLNVPQPRTFVGLKNYTTLFGQTQFRDAAWVTVKMTASSVLLSLLFGTLLALLIDRKFLGQGVVRTFLITPFLIMPVISALLWSKQMLDASFGVFNWIITAFGGEPVAFVSKYPIGSIVAALVWQWTPFMMLIILAGLQSQPNDVLEAARVDGATSFGIFRQLTLPHLRSYMELGILLGTIYLIQVYGHIKEMTEGRGSTNLPYYVYEKSLGGGWDFGKASAASVLVVIASIVIATFALRVLSSLLKGEDAA